MLGRHYTFKSSSNPDSKRNYTVSNCMKKDVYEEYIRLLNEMKSNSSDDAA